LYLINVLLIHVKNEFGSLRYYCDTIDLTGTRCDVWRTPLHQWRINC